MKLGRYLVCKGQAVNLLLHLVCHSLLDVYKCTSAVGLDFSL